MLRLILLVLLFLTSLLTVYKAPEYHLWLLAVMVSEYGVFFVMASVIILLTGYWTTKFNTTGTLIGMVALLLYLSPIIRAYIAGKNLPADMDKALGKTATETTYAKAFTFVKLLQKDQRATFKTLNYNTYPDTGLTLDYYQTQSTGKRPCVVVIHGGSWSSGDSRQLPELNAVLVSEGYQVASINYRLSPRWKNPAPVQDVTEALIYLRDNANKFKIDTSKFVLLGRSAGAQIALLAAYTLKNQGIKAVIDFYGPADMVWGYSLPAPKLIMDSRRVMANYLGGYYNEVPKNYTASSPIEFINRSTVPTLIIHGKNDVLVAYGHSERLNQKLQQYHVPHYWLQLPWATHGFDHHLNGPGGQLSTYAVKTFLKKTVNK